MNLKRHPLRGALLGEPTLASLSTMDGIHAFRVGAGKFLGWDGHLRHHSSTNVQDFQPHTFGFLFDSRIWERVTPYAHNYLHVNGLILYTFFGCLLGASKARFAGRDQCSSSCNHAVDNFDSVAIDISIRLDATFSDCLFHTCHARTAQADRPNRVRGV